MKGSIGYDKKLKRFFVFWYSNQHKRTVKVWFYNGLPLTSKDLAERLLSNMRADVDRGMFTIDKYLRGRTDVGAFLDEWYQTMIKDKKSPATQQRWRQRIDNIYKPFFKERGYALNEITFKQLMELASWRAGWKPSTQQQILAPLKVAFRYAKKVGKIETMPEFPGAKDLGVEKQNITWIPSDRQERIFSYIPNEHQPIFRFLQMYLRRPAEALVLKKEDVQGDVIIVRRTLSGDVIKENTKTNNWTVLPIIDDFKPYLEQARKAAWALKSPFLFVPRNYSQTGKYGRGRIHKIWKEACLKAGEDIQLYNGLKHSGASQLLNEHGANLAELAVAMNCNMATVYKYAAADVAPRKAVFNLRHFAPKSRLRSSE